MHCSSTHSNVSRQFSSELIPSPQLLESVQESIRQHPLPPPPPKKTSCLFAEFTAPLVFLLLAPLLPSRGLPFAQLVFLQSEWRNPASRKTCSGCWNAACSLPTWPSTPATLGKNSGGLTPRYSAPSARISDSCSWGPRPGRR